MQSYEKKWNKFGYFGKILYLCCVKETCLSLPLTHTGYDHSRRW